MREFFSSESLSNFLQTKLELNENVGEKLNYDLIFQKLLEAIQESSLGSMLNMMGGSKALPLKEPIKIKIKEVFDDLSLKIENNEDTIYQLKENIENIIDKRLNELTPEHIKIIMKNMIQKHHRMACNLGWCFRFFNWFNARNTWKYKLRKQTTFNFENTYAKPPEIFINK